VEKFRLGMCEKLTTLPSTKLGARPECVEGGNGNTLDNIDDVPFVLRLSKHERIF